MSEEESPGPSLDPSNFKLENVSDDSCWELPPDLHHKVNVEFGESMESIKSKIEELRSRLLQLEDINASDFDLSDRSLLRFLRGKKFRVNSAYEVVLNNFKFRQEHPDWFNVRKEEIELFMSMIKVSADVDSKLRRSIIILPYKLALTNDFMKTNPMALTKFRIWLFEQLSHDPYAQLSGIVVVVSFQRLTFWETTKLSKLASISEHTECVRYATKCSGFRLKKLMIFEEPFFFGFIWAALHIILSEKIRSRFKICGNDYSKLEENITNLDKLPACLGGTGSDDMLQDNWIKQMYEENF